MESMKKIDIIDQFKAINESQLKEADFDFDEVEGFLDQLGKLTSLRKLTFRKISYLPKGIISLNQIEELTLQGTGVEMDLNYLIKLKNLKILEIEDVPLGDFPEEVLFFDELERLALINCKIKQIHKDIGKLKKLKSLNLAVNQVKEIPNEILSLEHLESLWLFDNKINYLPDFIFNLIKLVSFSIENNPLEFFPDGIENLRNMRYIRLGRINIGKIPDGVFLLSELRSLSCRSENIKELQPHIANLTKLEKLDLSKNKLMYLPNEICKLNNLVEISLAENILEELPKDIGNLTSLKILDLESNKLSRLPVSMNNLNLAADSESRIWEPGLNLNKNLIKLPEEMKNKNPQDIIRFILDIQESRLKKKILEAKLTFIGSGEVGKTSLINMILTGTCGKPGKTNGIEIKDWEVKKNQDIIKLHIWDFGGQEIMHATHKFFMTKRSSYVLVVNPRTEDKYGDSEIEYWLKLIRSYAGDVPVVIAINKCEEHSIDIGKGELQDKYKNIVGFVETSCHQNKGIEKLKKLITKSITHLKHIDFLLPQTYFNIKQELEKNNKDYIPYHEYEKICKDIDNGFESESMSTLVGLLHDLGIMLNFRTDNFVSLRNTQVLNPEWVTRGVYQIITSKKVINKKGILTIDEITKILDKKKYPSIVEQKYIMDIMQNFELCYQLIDKPGNYFIPGAFPKDRPIFNWNPNQEDFINFQYHYDVMPNSIISRFIVRIHQLIRDSDYWRNGAVIGKDDCFALIKADPSDRKIVIEVIGKGNKRDLLSFIRSQLDLIHENLSSIQVRKCVLVKDGIKEDLVDYDELLFAEKMNIPQIPNKTLGKVIGVKSILDGVEDQMERERNYINDKSAESRKETITPVKESLKILFLTSNPDDTTRLRCDKEIREVEEGLKRSKKRDEFNLIKKTAVRVSDLNRALLEIEPHIVHFSGHGAQTDSSGSGGIVLEDNFGYSKIVSANALCNIFRVFKRTVRCVVLNSCFSEEQALEIVKHVPFVIGMKDSIGDDEAIVFATNFYDALGAGKEIEFAFEFAKVALETEGLLGKDIPKLLMRKNELVNF